MNIRITRNVLYILRVHKFRISVTMIGSMMVSMIGSMMGSMIGFPKSQSC